MRHTPSNDSYGPALRVVSRLLQAEVVSLFLIEPERPSHIRLFGTSTTELRDVSFEIPDQPMPGCGLTPAICSEHLRDNSLTHSIRLGKKDLTESPFRSGSPPAHLESGECIG